jgi:hypothetical protein
MIDGQLFSFSSRIRRPRFYPNCRRALAVAVLVGAGVSC